MSYEKYKFYSMTPKRWSSTKENIQVLSKMFNRQVEIAQETINNYEEIVNDLYTENQIIVKIFNDCFDVSMHGWNTYSPALLKVGDSVIYAKRHPAKILDFLPATDEFKVEFDDPNLMPRCMTVPTHMVSPNYAVGYGSPVQSKNIDVFCPKCDVKWKESMGFRFSFFDCPTCGMRKEDACSFKA